MMADEVSNFEVRKVVKTTKKKKKVTIEGEERRESLDLNSQDEEVFFQFHNQLVFNQLTD